MDGNQIVEQLGQKDFLDDAAAPSILSALMSINVVSQDQAKTMIAYARLAPKPLRHLSQLIREHLKQHPQIKHVHVHLNAQVALEMATGETKEPRPQPMRTPVPSNN